MEIELVMQISSFHDSYNEAFFHPIYLLLTQSQKFIEYIKARRARIDVSNFYPAAPRS
jgi:hypothetical protein